jgi:hypothetical protein
LSLLIGISEMATVFAMKALLVNSSILSYSSFEQMLKGV